MKSLRIVGLVIAVMLLTSGIWMLGAQERETLTKEQQLAKARRAQHAATELLLVERTVASRKEYLKSIKELAAFYEKAKNPFKLKMARKELGTLAKVEPYQYSVIGETLGPDIRPNKHIPEAEKIYKEARRYHKLFDVSGDNKRKALKLYLKLISTHHQSLRTSEAAYHAAKIYRHTVRDHYRAVVYFERTYQWDSMTEFTARREAAETCYYDLKDNGWARRLYEVCQKEAHDKGFRGTAKAIADMLRGQGH